MALFLSACSGMNPRPAPPVAATPPPPAAPPASAALPAPTTEKLTADATRATAGGTTFTAPGGWTLRSDGSKRVLDGYFPDLRLAIVDVGVAGSAEAAVAQAWPALVPDFARRVEVATDWVPRYGWEQRKRFSYETSPDERLFVMAQAFRKGNGWTVMLVHSGESSFAKREGQVVFVLNSLRPAGYTRETFQGRTAHALDAARVQALKDFVETARTQLGVPGVAVSLFTTDSVIFEGGFGVREIGKSAPVDADTLFMCAFRAS
jgi:hypothetical protein